ncbi:N-acetylglucosaminyl-phosphatidylinositol biosynthetic protein gpi1 isoform X2 [Prunus yedoensis var. nudiflora]|uniref:N-acetylglucosaminyl-phosphatidylinositol biosynthetic protein gpi1 isoform X2 n=1 Tax=Prunus yedoensis var. nudiflora TaxID=2094558 RepID=A0A314Y1Y5_PRUYE|nr:N-acetylglucosaminyl-phosphatidylinositol biosynthetic protein gpi1 isoform X2 [Prunus yedoensis var. nudiflora]
MGRRCRVWWPKQLSLSTPSSCSNFLLGWFISSPSSSLDVVVAFACTEQALSDKKLSIQGILHDTNGRMPVLLQDKSLLCIVGQFFKVHSKEDQYHSSCCGCHNLNGSLEQCRQPFVGSSYWIQMLCDPQEQVGTEISWIPKLHHIHWNGQMVFPCDIHLIFYETPAYGAHHFSLHPWNSFDQVNAPERKPKWVDELHQKQPLLDLDTVILAINSSAAADKVFERCMGPKKSTVRFSTVYMFLAFTWQLFAVSVASLSMLFYVIVQFLYRLLKYASDSWVYIISVKVFSSSRINIRIRCSQILYWPIFLQDNGTRSLSSVEYAEKAALHKHSMWSSLAVDVLLGNLFGLALLYHAESACMWVQKFASDITNELLRSGCVWLMGVPAGFKLNTELAGVLGMISLTAIQIWSTIWIFLGFHFIYFIRGLAISGIIFGVTIPAALIKDLIALATLHVSTLHWLISLLYSTQIQALAALWRLFGGRKWNPLRQRLDSYDYTVKQHIVGSLLFTPLLLLLPTTSVFYIFFTIMNTTISLIYILIEITISVIHATPYIKIFLWLVMPKRFPSGIWFEIVSVWSDCIYSHKDISSPADKLQSEKCLTGERASVVVSFLHSNFLTVGQIVMPHYNKILSGKPRTLVATAAYGVLTGRRIPSTIGTDLPIFPWMLISYKEYWRLCHDSILACYRR